MSKIFIISEIGINHNGNLDIAKKMIDASKEAGADAVKFQKRDIESVYTQEELDNYRESPWGTTNREQKEGLEFSIKEYQELYSYTKEFGMDFMKVLQENVDSKILIKHLNRLLIIRSTNQYR